jgi:queuosine precursor transporter
MTNPTFNASIILNRKSGIGMKFQKNIIFIIALYLGAIVIANLLVAYYGPKITIVCAFAFIGLDLTTRDNLHDAWRRQGLVWKMGVLILTGSVLSVILNWNAWQIALASCIAFASAAIMDTVIYHILREKTRFLRVNGSNVVSAVVDSIVFPSVAFGVFMPWIVLGQFAAKVFGGMFWFFILSVVSLGKGINRREVDASSDLYRL